MHNGLVTLPREESCLSICLQHISETTWPNLTKFLCMLAIAQSTSGGVSIWNSGFKQEDSVTAKTAVSIPTKFCSAMKTKSNCKLCTGGEICYICCLVLVHWRESLTPFYTKCGNRLRPVYMYKFIHNVVLLYRIDWYSSMYLFRSAITFLERRCHWLLSFYIPIG